MLTKKNRKKINLRVTILLKFSRHSSQVYAYFPKASKYFVLFILSGHQLIALGSKYKMYRSSFINPFFIPTPYISTGQKVKVPSVSASEAAVKTKHTEENTHEFGSVRHIGTSVNIQKRVNTG